MSDAIALTEEWRTIPDDTDYEVSNWGRIRSHKARHKTPRVLKTYTCKLGYVRVHLNRHGGSVHRCVAAAWLGPCPDGLEVDHINGIRSDNSPDNLRYVTRQENLACRIKRRRVSRCKHGHYLSGDNLYIRPSGSRACRTCAKELVRELRAERTGHCTAPDCGRGAYVWRDTDHALCEMHYQRKRKADKRAQRLDGAA